MRLLEKTGVAHDAQVLPRLALPPGPAAVSVPLRGRVEREQVRLGVARESGGGRGDDEGGGGGGRRPARSGGGGGRAVHGAAVELDVGMTHGAELAVRAFELLQRNRW